MLAFVTSIYFSTLAQFAFVSHPVVYCFLLLICSLSASTISYLILGFSWYLALFCLVYVGGVYVLFIFISIHNPNPTPFLGIDTMSFISLFFIFFIILSLFDFSAPCITDERHLLCSFFEGFTYCLYCLILLVGFCIISLVSSDKGSFYR